ncbi:efflux transporter outer membrane subunit [Novosphingobium sp. KCTC 2891]|uniref:efflux transporter outer membrane subunit n=1 Tax=Novosphingobium sp. KCTC 2891 TaxID=2989730 RepID=UPI002221B384|nr:efflux transporter outer membrane subunit [Novosphingobium sp. KCTC 2891]MCW1384142.1 efflux transporter outer membrane subunit [Novosphingobium sp. KCTC 2891]
MRRKTALTLAPALVAGLLLSACTTVGPNYTGAPDVASNAASRGAFLRADAAARAEAPAASWWQALGDPVLDGLIADALAGSPNVAIANARIAQARAGLAANRTAILPSVNVSAAAPYFNVPGGLFSSNGQSGGRDSVNVYNVGFDSSWEIDLFGGTRRKIEAASARADAAEAGLADAQVTLSAEIARAYVALRARQAVLSVLDRQAAIDDQLVQLAQARLSGGTAPEQPLNEARGQRAQTEGDRAKARADVTVLADQLAVLTGREPGTLDSLIASPGPVPLPPESVAVGDPALLLRSRPDVRIAERQLAAANADVGVQIANRFPKISFLGLLGLGGQNIGDIFDPSKIIGLAVPQLKWSLFDGGRTEAQIRNAKGAYAEAEATYRARVLGALQDAETSLTRFGGQRITFAKALEGQGQAARSASLQQQRAQAGTIGRSDALTAERQALQAQLAAVSARADLTTGFIAVEKSLGLGWAPAP